MGHQILSPLCVCNAQQQQVLGHFLHPCFQPPSPMLLAAANAPRCRRRPLASFAVHRHSSRRRSALPPPPSQRARCVISGFSGELATSSSFLLLSSPPCNFRELEESV